MRADRVCLLSQFLDPPVRNPFLTKKGVELGGIWGLCDMTSFLDLWFFPLRHPHSPHRKKESPSPQLFDLRKEHQMMDRSRDLNSFSWETLARVEGANM